MIRYLILSFLVVVFQPLFVPEACAGSWYMGAGLSQVHFGIDLKNYRNIDSATGPEIVLGYQTGSSLAWESLAAFSKHEEQGAADNPSYMKIELGPRFVFDKDSSVRHSLGLGFGYHSLDNGGGSPSNEGPGAYFDAGVEEFSGRRHSVRLRLRWSYWVGDNDHEALTTTLGLTYNYHPGK